ncbi:hypothetical protein SAMN05446037_103428 [Anaerovirgula multivorans]|uniref:Uncharacterized protein n=1 Tax=Anaerovirgula multivorans TaxID=312168 RepID=A0A239JAF2_9FIRM|nr:hypothetical protein [Anaerovirgula multivorans]SNT02857.1 hypothetical protein SAMN05446037_103428 [Anaerovirgula multivorans]
MEASTSFKKRSDRLQKALLCTIEDFRKGNDHLALDNFLNSMDDLENLLEYQQYVGDLRRKIDRIPPTLQTLHDYVKNQDVIGITDLLEFTLYPLIEAWIEGCDEE